MIELAQIKTTDTLGQLRGQLNTAFNEIQTDQPFIGRVINPSVNIYNPAGGLTHAVTASSMGNSQLFALCFPESNGIFVARVFGYVNLHLGSSYVIGRCVIDVPAVKLPTRNTSIGTFVSPAHLGLSDDNTHYAGMGTMGQQPIKVSIEQDDATCNVILTTLTGVNADVNSYISLA